MYLFRLKTKLVFHGFVHRFTSCGYFMVIWIIVGRGDSVERSDTNPAILLRL